MRFTIKGGRKGLNNTNKARISQTLQPLTAMLFVKSAPDTRSMISKFNSALEYFRLSPSVFPLPTQYPLSAFPLCG